MKAVLIRLSLLVTILFTGASFDQDDSVEFVCMKKQIAANQCHYNFKVDGGKYRFVDIGCRWKKEDVLAQAKEGTLALAKDWKIECGIAKEKKEEKGY